MTFSQLLVNPVRFYPFICNLVLKVALVTDNYDRNVLLLGFSKVVKPSSAVEVALVRAHIVDNYATIASSVERLAKCLVPLLACSVPHLHVDFTTIFQLNLPFNKVSPDCRLLRL